MPHAPGAGGLAQRRWLLRLGLDLRPGEWLPTALLFLGFFLLIAFQYAARTVRQSTFIDALGAARLPYVYLLVALASYPVLRLYARLADGVKRHQLAAASGAVVALSMGIFWWLFQFPWRWVPVAFYAWLSIAVVLTMSQLWSFAAGLFDARQARRLFAVIGAGGLLGGIAGAQAARLAAAAAGTRSALLVAAGLLLGVSALVLLVHRLHPAPIEAAARASSDSARLDEARGGFALLRGSRHLRLMALLMTLGVAVAQVVDLQFSWAAEQATSSLAERTAFFANFYSVMGVVAFVFQILFTSRIHRLLGMGFAMRVLPGVMGLGTLALLLAAGLFPVWLIPAAMVLKVGEGGLRHSLDQATRELLFLPVPAGMRMKAKTIIDVFVQRGAEGVGALLLLPVALGVMSPAGAGWITLALVAGWLAVTVPLRREYVATFRRGLRQRGVDSDTPIDVSDAATLELLFQSLGSLDPRQVLQGLDLLAAHRRGHLVPPLLLHHDDAAVRRRTLEILGRARRRDAAPLVAGSLGDEDAEVRAQAVRTLADLEGRGVIELMRARAGDAHPGVRAAAVCCFAAHGGEEMAGEAARLLADLLSDADPAARREGAKAIGSIPEPQFRGELVALLYDRDPTVVGAAIAAVRRRASRDVVQPLYVPCLVSLLRHPRLKHEAREALVAFGPPVIPALSHFMGADDEQIWVRRAIPKTLAGIDAPAAVVALVDALRGADDRFLRRKLVEALASLPAERRRLADAAAVTAEVRAEVHGWFATALPLRAIGLAPAGALTGCSVVWREAGSGRPTLLQRLLAERLDDHLANLFGLLGVLHPSNAMRIAGRNLASPWPSVRSHALEYLDNTLDGALKRLVFAAIGDEPLDERLARGCRLFGLEPPDRLTALRALSAGGREGDACEEGWVAAAAVYEIHRAGDEELRPHVEALAEQSADPLVRETAAWVLARSAARVLSYLPREVMP